MDPRHLQRSLVHSWHLQSEFYVNLARPWCTVVWSNTHLGVAVKVSVDMIHIFSQLSLSKADFAS